ncbi:MAG: nuclear transport factor 2 family protein [Chloroflexi bacterium]|nr:nuclear transport factor 2 family protein [Chloroflexota bacterium]
MYNTIVRAQVTKLFDELNKGNYEPILNGLAKDFEHWFVGNHALSGRRNSLAVTRAWYERLFKIFPNIHFDLCNILITGRPWNTLVAVEWTDHYTLLNGEKRTNCGVHLIRLCWGKGVSVRIYCDTHLLLENLAIQERGGIADAAYEPLVG